MHRLRPSLGVLPTSTTSAGRAASLSNPRACHPFPMPSSQHARQPSNRMRMSGDAHPYLQRASLPAGLLAAGNIITDQPLTKRMVSISHTDHKNHKGNAYLISSVLFVRSVAKTSFLHRSLARWKPFGPHTFCSLANHPSSSLRQTLQAPPQTIRRRKELRIMRREQLLTIQPQ